MKNFGRQGWGGTFSLFLSWNTLLLSAKTVHLKIPNVHQREKVSSLKFLNFMFCLNIHLFHQLFNHLKGYRLLSHTLECRPHLSAALHPALQLILHCTLLPFSQQRLIQLLPAWATNETACPSQICCVPAFTNPRFVLISAASNHERLQYPYVTYPLIYIELYNSRAGLC